MPARPRRTAVADAGNRGRALRGVASWCSTPVLDDSRGTGEAPRRWAAGPRARRPAIAPRDSPPRKNGTPAASHLKSWTPKERPIRPCNARMRRRVHADARMARVPDRGPCGSGRRRTRHVTSAPCRTEGRRRRRFGDRDPRRSVPAGWLVRAGSDRCGRSGHRPQARSSPESHGDPREIWRSAGKVRLVREPLTRASGDGQRWTDRG